MLGKRSVCESDISEQAPKKHKHDKSPFKPIHGYLDLEMNSEGVARSIATRKVIKPYTTFIKVVTESGKRCSRSVEKLQLSVFPPPDLDGEIWKLSLADGYEVSNMGRVRHAIRRKPLRSALKVGYMRISILNSKYFVHVLVARAFLTPPSEDQTTVNHINGIKSDNRVANLEWASQSEQSFHAVKTGLRSVTSYNGQAVIYTDPQTGIDTYYSSIRKAAKTLGISESKIKQTCEGTRTDIAPMRFGEKIVSQTRQAVSNFPWHDIEGFSNYQISQDGQVRNKVTGFSIKHTPYEYIRVGMVDDNNKKTCLRPLHILMAKAFIPNPDNLSVVHHIDANRHNNSIENLQWTTLRCNTEYAIAKKVYEFNPSKVLIAEYASVRRASEASGVPYSTMSRLCGLKMPALKHGSYFSYQQTI